jgi:hypothetical protein
MKCIIGLMIAPMLLTAQMREDLFDDVDMKTIFIEENGNPLNDLLFAHDHYAHYYAKYKVAEISRRMTETKSTSVYIYYKGQLDAYLDIINYFEDL